MTKILSLFLFVAMSLCATGIPPFLPPESEYDPDITTPSEFLGYAVGERHITHAELVAYMNLLAGESERINLLEIGRTHGQRPLIHLRISSPDNLSRLDSIQEERRALMDPAKARRLDYRQLPVVMNLNYTVHGNEASGANAAVVIAWHLAAATDIDDLLAQTMIVLDPVLNPDGMDRFANWTNSFSGKNPSPDPNAMEHREGWPNGRTNYYWFDLNRDWLLLTQPESRARLTQFNKWMPDFVLDFHEMGTNNTYFFQPGVPERNNPLTPQATHDLTKHISRYFAEALDAAGSLYFSEERFDDFYIGKGSTMPDLKGSVGILFEQASARGIIQDSVNGPLSFPFAIQNQVTTSLACLKAVQELHDELLENKKSFFSHSLQAAREAGFSGYQFASPGDPARAMEFVKVLRGHGILVEEMAGENAWYLPLNQPQYLFLESMVETRTEFEANIFYDITAWTLPMAYNLDWKKLKSAPKTGAGTAVVPGLESSTLGYLVDWSGLNAPKLLLDLLQEDVLVKVARKPLSMASRTFGYGTLFIPVSLQSDKADRIHKILEQGIQNDMLTVVPVTSFLTEEGIDLGSQDLVRIDKPRILLAAGSGINAYNIGSIWHLLDVYHEYPVTLLDVARLDGTDLAKYTAIVLAGHDYGVLSEHTMTRLKDWIHGGGTLVCLGSSVKWAVDKELVGLSFVSARSPEDNDGTDTTALRKRPRRAFAEAADDRALESIRGAIFRAAIDCTHPLAFGYDQDFLPVFASGTQFLEPSKNRYQTPLVFDSEPLVAGYASEKNLEKLTGSAAAVVETQGQGAVVLFGHYPTFRAYWRGTEKLLLNALFFGKLMKASDPGAYSDDDE